MFFIPVLICLLAGYRPSVDALTEYYSYDGQGNNIANPDWGTTESHYLRNQMETGYDDDAGSMNHASGLPGARLISNSLTLPSYKSRQRNAQQLTDMLVFVGQLLKHEMTLTKTASDEDEPISVPFCDFYHDKATCGLDAAALAAATPQTIPFTRSAFELDANGKRHQVNLVTAFIDGSSIYGHDSTTASKLRMYSKGKLMSYNDELPINTMNVDLVDPVGIETTFSLRVAGDHRANSHPITLALHSLFVREHNRLAEKFYIEDPMLSDEELYQKARKWVVALLQNLCYYEFLPTIGIELPQYTAYDATINPGIDAFFAAAAFRFGHSAIYDVILRVDDDGKEISAGHLLLHESYYRPTVTLSAGIEPLLRGASLALQGQVSAVFSNALRNYLFGSPKHGGLDLLALNIQRGRDHGLPSYNSARTQLQLTAKTSFQDITSDYYLAKDLEAIYATVDNVDAYVGGLAEDTYANSSVGELFYTSIREQFIRLRDGDRFYFEHLGNGLFTAEDVSTIRATSLRDIILRNTDIQVLPENIFVRNSSSPWPRKVESTPSPTDTVESKSPLTDIGDDFLSEKASIELVPSVYTLEWQLEVIDAIEFMRFTLICSTTGWVGLGFAKGSVPYTANTILSLCLDATSAMVEADVVIGKVASGVPSVDDYWAFSFAQPSPDTSLGGTKDIELISGSEENGKTTIVFRRQLATSDINDHSISKTSTTPIIFAWHSSTDDLQYHSVTNRGKTEIDFYGMLPIRVTGPSADLDSRFQQTVFGGNIPIDALSDLSLSWTIVNSTDHKWLNATLRMKTTGLCYVAVGFQKIPGELAETDLIKVESSGRYCDIHDSWAIDSETVKYDYMLGGNNNLENTYCTTKDGYIEAGFMRLTDTGDAADIAVVENGYGNLVILWDRSDVNFKTQTLHSKSFEVDFFTMQGSKAWETAEDIPIDSPGPSTSPTSPDSIQPPQGKLTLDEENEYTISYTVLGSDIQVELSLKGTGFAGVGVPGADRNMHSADIIVAASDGEGGCRVDDYWSETFARPQKDTDMGGSDDLRDKVCKIEDGYIKASFVRTFGRGDEFDRNFATNATSGTIIYAFHISSNGLEYHGTTWRGVRDINFVPESTGSEELLEEEFDDGASMELAEGYKVWWKIIGSGSTSLSRKKSRKLMQEGELDNDAEVIIKLERKSTGWMGFGIEPTNAAINGMQDTDMYVGWISPDSTVTLMDSWSVGFMLPETDAEQGGQNSILQYAGEEKDGVSTIIFKRKVDTGDDFDRVIKSNEQAIVFAYGDGDGLPAGGHGPCCRGKTMISWSSDGGAASSPRASDLPNENLKTAHAWIMILGWAIFAILGVLISHIGRHWKYWVQAHVAFEITAALFSSLGEIISLAYTDGKIRGAHGALSFVLLFTMVPQLFVGYRTWATDKTYMKKIHRGLGYFVIGTACWQMWLGMKLFHMDTRFVQCFYAWLISIGVAFNFAAEAITAHELKSQMKKKGIEIEDAASKKIRRSSSKSVKAENEENEAKTKLLSKKQSGMSKDAESFSIKTNSPFTVTSELQKKENGDSKKIDAQEFMDASAEGRQWTVINQKVYDMTKMIEKHPGGPEQILDIIGKDGSELYNTHHGTNERAHKSAIQDLCLVTDNIFYWSRMLAKTFLGDLVDGNSTS